MSNPRDRSISSRDTIRLAHSCDQPEYPSFGKLHPVSAALNRSQIWHEGVLYHVRENQIGRVRYRIFRNDPKLTVSKVEYKQGQ